MGKQTGDWKLTLFPSHLALADAPCSQPYVILREQLMKSVMLIEGTRALVLDQPRKLTFRLTKEGTAALADWIGKPFLASYYLKRRYAWVSLWAWMWVVGSLLVLLPSARGGVSSHFNVPFFLLGLVLLISSGFARWRPHPILFLIDSLWFAMVAIDLTVDVAYGRSKGWLVLAALLVWVAINGVRHFIRFRGVKMEPVRK